MFNKENWQEWTLAMIQSAIQSAAGTEIYVAGETMGSQKLVMLKNGEAFLFDQTDELNTYKAIGFTKTAVNIGDNVEVIYFGLLESAGWGLTPDTVYYANGSLGIISLTPPSVGISQAVGIALDSDTLLIELEEPVIVI